LSAILITGASGFIGQGLAPHLAGRHEVVCMSRGDPGLELPWVRGDFGSPEDLRQLDGHSIDVVVHLAAVTGGCLERDGMLVNVEGTRRLMRYLIDRGCRKFVMASSIAAVGFQSRRFRPLQLPIPDTHPCLDRDGYGLSKYLMEEVTAYYQRQVEEIDVINLRLSSVCLDKRMPQRMKAGPLGEWALGGLTVMARSDAVRAFSAAAEALPRTGVRTMNAAGPKAWAADPVAEILRGWWGEEVDLSYFEREDRRHESVFDVGLIERELGFVAAILP
jgi:UDP-glucose 4-epimerase